MICDIIAPYICSQPYVKCETYSSASCKKSFVFTPTLHLPLSLEAVSALFQTSTAMQSLSPPFVHARPTPPSQPHAVRCCGEIVNKTQMHEASSSATSQIRSTTCTNVCPRSHVNNDLSSSSVTAAANKNRPLTRSASRCCISQIYFRCTRIRRDAVTGMSWRRTRDHTGIAEDASTMF